MFLVEWRPCVTC